MTFAPKTNSKSQKFEIKYAFQSAAHICPYMSSAGAVSTKSYQEDKTNCSEKQKVKGKEEEGKEGKGKK